MQRFFTDEGTKEESLSHTNDELERAFRRYKCKGSSCTVSGGSKKHKYKGSKKRKYKGGNVYLVNNGAGDIFSGPNPKSLAEAAMLNLLNIRGSDRVQDLYNNIRIQVGDFNTSLLNALLGATPADLQQVYDNLLTATTIRYGDMQRYYPFDIGHAHHYALLMWIKEIVNAMIDGNQGLVQDMIDNKVGFIDMYENPGHFHPPPPPPPAPAPALPAAAPPAAAALFNRDAPVWTPDAPWTQLPAAAPPAAAALFNRDAPVWTPDAPWPQLTAAALPAAAPPALNGNAPVWTPKGGSIHFNKRTRRYKRGSRK